MYGLMLHEAGGDWFRTADQFDDETEAHFEGSSLVRTSQDDYRKCVDAGIDVPFFDDYKVIKQ